MTQKQVNVAVNLWETSLRQLQLISQILGREGKVGKLVQTAVDEYIERIVTKPELVDKLRNLQSQHGRQRRDTDSAFDELLKMAGAIKLAGQTQQPDGEEPPTPPEAGGKVTRFPGNRTRRKRE